MTGEQKDDGRGTSVNINTGKGVDAALGDVIRSLLVKSAKAFGDLTSDSIDILGDRVKRKRELNAELGFEEVRIKLEADRIDVKSIIPPKEEELHLLINGLSLSDDKNVREMCASLFTKALDPNSSITPERPLISVVQSLSPTDAKVIDFLAFAMTVDNDLRRNMIEFKLNDFLNITPEEREKLNEAQKNEFGTSKESNPIY